MRKRDAAAKGDRARSPFALRSNSNKEEVLFVHIGYIIALIFFVIWVVFKIIEATKERNKKKDIEDDEDLR